MIPEAVLHCDLLYTLQQKVGAHHTLVLNAFGCGLNSILMLKKHMMVMCTKYRIHIRLNLVVGNNSFLICMHLHIVTEIKQ